MRGPKGGQSQIIAKVSLRKLYARTGELLLAGEAFVFGRGIPRSNTQRNVHGYF